MAAIQLEKAGLDHLLRHILAVDADGRSGRADSIKEMQNRQGRDLPQKEKRPQPP